MGDYVHTSVIPEFISAAKNFMFDLTEHKSQLLI
jgi:hypothetical protein